MSAANPKPDLSHFLAAMPPFLLVDVVDDELFRDELGFTVTPTTTVGSLRFAGEKLHVAVKQMLQSEERRVELVDEDGVTCVIEEAQGQDGRKLLAVMPDGGERMLINGMYFQSGTKEERLEEFAIELKFAGLPPDDCAGVRAILEERPLTFEEQREFIAELSVGPVAVIERIFRELEKPEGNMAALVPSSRRYYERLCGSGEALTVEELAASVTPQAVERLLAWDPERGARFALALAGHPAVLMRSALTRLSLDNIKRLAQWALDDGDPLAKVAVIELGLEALQRTAELAGIVETLVKQLLALDPDDPDSELNLLNAMFVFIVGEFSRLHILDEWPPFRRRQAAMAHAALFTRMAHGRVHVARFAQLVFERHVQRFYSQSIVDLRKEPRWLPDYATPRQLRDELIGRILNAGGRFAKNIVQPSLRKLLVEQGRGSVAKVVGFPGSFFPGPMEGASKDGCDTIPPEYQKILDQTLEADELTPGSVIALINTSGLFGLDRERVERAVTIIRAGGHRFMGEVDKDKRDELIAGLGAVAAASRSVELASELRIMLRKLRIDGLDPPEPHVELLLGAAAAAAFENEGEWIGFVGSMANELAFSVNDRGHANGLEMTISSLCGVMPHLRTVAGKGLSALRAFRRS
jgi:hypothetical protein